MGKKEDKKSNPTKQTNNSSPKKGRDEWKEIITKSLDKNKTKKDQT